MIEPGSAALMKALLHLRGVERRKVYETIHDRIGGGLTAVGLELGLLDLDSPPQLSDRIRRIQTILETAFAEIRGLSYAVHPDPAARFGLAASLEKVAQRFERRTGRKTVLEISMTQEPPPEKAALFYDRADWLLACFAAEKGSIPVKLKMASDPGGYSLKWEDPHTQNLDTTQTRLLQAMSLSGDPEYVLELKHRTDDRHGTIIEFYG